MPIPQGQSITPPAVEKIRNRLGSETSPYLLQHAGNPVHWQPWDADALARATREDKPILLSIGYSACHWCHIMAHESFADEATATVMNRLYVNIKVDREERPDLDRVYQIAHQMLTRRAGGWPLTVVLTPEGHAPIFAGTYFPPEPRHGMPAFRQILEQVEAHYRRHREEMSDHDEAMRRNLKQLTRLSPGESPAPDELEGAARAMLDDTDRDLGGFGRAPKFPHVTALEFLLKRSGSTASAPKTIDEAIAVTLDAMSRGGLFDQLGGGFFRYSVDDAWTIPHFEKMLYDNALLMPLYAQAARVLERSDYRRIAIETAEWTIREMQLEDGGYCSSLDADSEGEEGKYYVFDIAEIERVLDAGDCAFARNLLGLDGPPNFEGRYHLNRRLELAEAAVAAGLDPGCADAAWERSRRALLLYRESRTRPDRDDKCLTSWNALMIKGMAVTGRLLGCDDLLDSAERALDFLRSRHTDGIRLYASSRDGVAHLDAYLDDYVFFADALLELLKCRWRESDLDHCIELVDFVLEHFRDSDGGGLFFTADFHEQLLHRPKAGTDESVPSGNGVLGRLLLELGHLLGETRYLDEARAILESYSHDMLRYPLGHGAILTAWKEWHHPGAQVIITGNRAEAQEWQTRLNYEPGLPPAIYAIGNGASRRVPLAATRGPGNAVAWICAGSRCLPPVTRYALLPAALARTVE
ncbi:MAG: thioredoxin domain-containing protein [Proteobacteria bacterium]|nr:MAG: thioredoxin domain-containing protein [Pseudomonadota bacterium]